MRSHKNRLKKISAATALSSNANQWMDQTMKMIHTNIEIREILSAAGIQDTVSIVDGIRMLADKAKFRAIAA